jgi:hypothetical protein
MAWTAPVNFAEPMIVDETDMNLMQDNIRESWHEVAYVEFTSNVTTTTNVEATPLDIVSSGAITYVANPILIEFFSPYVTIAGSGGISLWDASTDLGRLWSNVSGEGPVHLARRLTPTAASHTYKLRLWETGGTTSTVHAGAGGVGVTLPGFIRVMQKGGA